MLSALCNHNAMINNAILFYLSAGTEICIKNISGREGSTDAEPRAGRMLPYTGYKHFP